MLINAEINKVKINKMIKGFIKTSFVDYPEKICSTIFIGGCNFRCPYCHNPDIVFNRKEDIPFDTILKHLNKRKGLTDAVCITGGEPTLWNELPDMIKKIKRIGLLVKLDTNGTNPEMIRELIKANLIDYVAMDIKAPLKKYKSITNTDVNIKKIEESVKVLINSDIDYEFRTTVHSRCTSEEDIIQIAEELKGAKRYVLQEFKYNTNLIDNAYIGTNNIAQKELQELKEKIIKLNLIKEVKVR